MCMCDGSGQRSTTRLKRSSFIQCVVSAMSSKTGASGVKPGPRRTQTWSLAGRLTALYAGSAFSLVLISTVLLHWSLVRSLAQEDDQFLIERAHGLRRLLNGDAAKSVELRWTGRVMKVSCASQAGHLCSCRRLQCS